MAQAQTLNAKVKRKNDTEAALTTGEGLILGQTGVSTDTGKMIHRLRDGSGYRKYYDSTDIDLFINGKQNKLTEGDNISIAGNIISAVDTIYDDTDVRALIFGKQDKLTAGNNISIEDNVISVTGAFYDDTEVRALINAEAETRANADDDLQTQVDGKVNRSGDTMTGFLTINAPSAYNDPQLRILGGGTQEKIYFGEGTATAIVRETGSGNLWFYGGPDSRGGVHSSVKINGDGLNAYEFFRYGQNLDDRYAPKNLVPSQANQYDNQLADKDFVNSSISNMASNYVTATADGNTQWVSFHALRTGPWYNKGNAYTPKLSDYAIFIDDDNSIWRANYDGRYWNRTYKVNDTPFTAAQLETINSGITLLLVGSYNTHLADTTIHITDSERTTWNGKANGTHNHNASNINAGTLALARGGLGVDASSGGTANTVFARPNGAAGAASFRALAAADIPGLNKKQNIYDEISSAVDLNTLHQTYPNGTILLKGALTNSPVTNWAWCQISTSGSGATLRVLQVLWKDNSGETWVRCYDGQGNRWIESKLYSTAYKPTAADVGAASASHNHSGSNITSGYIGLSQGGLGASYASKGAAAYGLFQTNAGNNILSYVYGEWGSSAGYKSVSTFFSDNKSNVLNQVGDSYVKRGTGTGIYFTKGHNVYVGIRDPIANTDSTTGEYNTHVGAQSGYKQTSGSDNCGLGQGSLYNNTTGGGNVAIGVNASRASGTTLLTEINNTVVLGRGANPSGNNASNQVVIGYNAVGTGNNHVVLGNNQISSLRCQVTTITALSDRRIKEEIESANLDMCIEAVRKLPITRYKYKNFTGYHADTHVTGFLADDVEKVFPKSVSCADLHFPVLDENGQKTYDTIINENGIEEKIEKTFLMEKVKDITMTEALPTLWGAVQKLIQKIESLENRLGAAV